METEYADRVEETSTISNRNAAIMGVLEDIIAIIVAAHQRTRTVVIGIAVSFSLQTLEFRSAAAPTHSVVTQHTVGLRIAMFKE